MAELETFTQAFYLHKKPKGGNPLEAETTLQETVANIHALNPSHSIPDAKFNSRLLHAMPETEYADVYTFFSDEAGMELDRNKIMAKLIARYNNLRQNKRGSTSTG